MRTQEGEILRRGLVSARDPRPLEPALRCWWRRLLDVPEPLGLEIGQPVDGLVRAGMTAAM